MDAKQRILLKAHELFNRYGIRSVSMDDIAAQLGMSKKTLYQYFVDKEELVRAVISSEIDSKMADCCRYQEEGENPIHEVFLSFDQVSQMFASMNPSILFDMEKYHPSAFRKFKEFQTGFLYEIIRNNLDRGVKEGLYREDIDIDTLSRYRIHTIMLSFNQEVFPNNRTHLVHIEHQLFEHFLYGLATTKGEKLIQKYKHQRTKK
jgi:TetR/AcrR family transcriptional regulator, cholesterol catabolism regulator